MHLSNMKNIPLTQNARNIIQLEVYSPQHITNIAIHKSQYSPKTVSIRVAVSCTYSFATKLSIYPCSASNPVERNLTLGYTQIKVNINSK